MQRLSSSFRDPSGFIFQHSGIIYRQVNAEYQADYEALIESGLYARLVERGLLISHEETELHDIPVSTSCYKTLRPQQIPFISYPYEWSFSQFKDAALTTLRIQAEALKHGLVLKDASAFNIQFINSKAVFIDSLSFEKYVDGTPWVAYKQFCQHFLAPLALMAYCDVELSKLLVSNIDGIPLQLASKLLPARSRLSYGCMAHIHFHSRMQQEYSDAASSEQLNKTEKVRVSKRGQTALVESLAGTINKLKWKRPATEWGDYYDKTNYSEQAGSQKRKMVADYLAAIPDALSVVQDFGANTGEFSEIAAPLCELVVSQDIDPVAVELNYQKRKTEGPANILPIKQDFASPSPAIGWGNVERESFVQRAQCDVILALALIHHLSISNNVPLSDVANLFANLSRWAIVEFVPKSDSQVERLLATREDIFPGYTQEGFEQAFSEKFEMVRSESVPDSERRLYLMKRIL